MKQIRLITGSLIAAFALLTACTPQTKQLETETHELQDTIWLIPGEPYCLSVDFRIDFPINSDENEVTQAIRQTLLANLFDEQYADLPIDEAMALYRDDLGIEYKANNEPFVAEIEKDASEAMYSLLHNEHILKGYVVYDNDKVFSYAIERYLFMGGAHGITTRLFYNFDLSTGRTFGEEDLFAENYTDALTGLLMEQLAAQDENVQSADELEDAGYFVENIHPNNNFYLSDEGLSYVFNPYEIAPYYMGETTITLPLDKLRPLLNPNQTVL